MHEQSRRDLLDDYAELRALAQSATQRLDTLRPLITEETVLPHTKAELEYQIAHHLEAYDAIVAALAKEPSYEGKARACDLLRTLQSTTAALLAAADWQSPSFAHTLRPQAGTQTGKIEGNITDYKRDVHLDAAAYEKAFCAAYIDPHGFQPLQAYATVSGMAAFTTALSALQAEGNAEGNILAGSGCYFQNKEVLERFFPGRVQYVNEIRVHDVLDAVDRLRPSVIVLDSLCNTDNVAVPNLPKLLPALAHRLRRRATLVLDNTTLATTLQPLAYLPRLGKLRLIVIESLNKYHQFGFDRVTGGIVWRGGLSPTKLMASRMHLGTIMPDASVLAMPVPNRTLLTKRLARLERNALHLAATLHAHITTVRHTPLSHVVYPGLSSHPAYEWTKDYPFRGSFFAIAFKPPFTKPLVYSRFITCVMHEAKKAGVQITSGTSFGFSTTRIYLTALYAHAHAKPFVRVAVGTETWDELQTLATVFARSADRVSFS